MHLSERSLMPDYLRLIALFGIVMVNVQFIAFSALGGFTEPMGKSLGDDLVLFVVNGLLLLKTYGLFSFMFGVGLGLLMRSSARRGFSLGPVYRNRMLGLLGLGLLHGCLFFPGDILVIYAICGSILYFLRNFPAARLVKLGAFLLTLQPIIALPFLLEPSDYPPEVFDLEIAAFGTGSFIDAALFRTAGFALTMPIFLIVQGVSALGWFCLGLAAVKSEMIDTPAHRLWHRARRFCLAPGVLLSVLGAGLWQWGPAEYGAALTIIVAPLATLGYLGFIAAISRPTGPILSRVLMAGGSSLSIYLGQSILLTNIFSAYGLGYWNSLNHAAASFIAILVTLALILGLILWRTRFPQGPFELLLRKITYLGTGAK